MDNEVKQIHPDDATLFAVGLTTPDTTTPTTYRKKLLAIEKFDAAARAEKITRLVTWAKIPVDSVCPLHETTAVMHSAKNGNFEAFETCLKMGAGLARQDDYGRSAVHFVCGTHDLEAASKMLDLCMSPNESVAADDQNMEHALSEKDHDGRVPIHYAAYRSNIEVITKLQGANNPKCNIHSKDNNGETALHYVCALEEGSYGGMLER
jgi:ankyrin repeat protein